MKQKPNLIYIHGGMTFKTHKDHEQWLRQLEGKLGAKKKWSHGYLDDKLGRQFLITRPRMPLADNAQYKLWKIAFENYLPKLKGKTIFVGESLGGTFFAKYLSENKLPKKAQAVFLVCPPFDNDLIDEDLVGGFVLGKDLTKIYENTKHLHLMFSADDDCVPVSHAEKYRAKLPDAQIHIYKSKNGHFDVPTFPEIVKMIKEDMK